MSIGPMLPAAIAKISTQTAGGWKISLDIPESAGEIIKQLIGTENKTVYTVSFDAISEIEQVKRRPGRPREKESG